MDIFLWNMFFCHLKWEIRQVHIFHLPFHVILQYLPHFSEVWLLIISSKYQTDHGDISFENSIRIP